MFKKIFLLSFISLWITTSTHAASLNPHHFKIQMLNGSNKNVTLSFREGIGHVELDPVLPDGYLLKPTESSPHYGVNIVPLDPSSTFNIIFKGEKECQFTVGFYAPGRPRITMEGLGCLGGGARLTEMGSTLLMYISDIDYQKK